jgi:hypothetical protein
MIIGQKELINLVFFLKKTQNKIKINLGNPIFRGSKGEDPKVFLREYKRACIGTKLKTTIEWLNFFPKFLKDTTSS